MVSKYKKELKMRIVQKAWHDMVRAGRGCIRSSEPLMDSGGSIWTTEGLSKPQSINRVFQMIQGKVDVDHGYFYIYMPHSARLVNQRRSLRRNVACVSCASNSVSTC